MNDLYFINRLISFHGANISTNDGTSKYTVTVYGTTITFNKDKFGFDFDNTKMIWDDNEMAYSCRYPKNEKEFNNFIKEIKYIGSDKFIEDFDNGIEIPTYIGDLYL